MEEQQSSLLNRRGPKPGISCHHQLLHTGRTRHSPSYELEPVTTLGSVAELILKIKGKLPDKGPFLPTSCTPSLSLASNPSLWRVGGTGKGNCTTAGFQPSKLGSPPHPDPPQGHRMVQSRKCLISIKEHQQRAQWQETNTVL